MCRTYFSNPLARRHGSLTTAVSSAPRRRAGSPPFSICWDIEAEVGAAKRFGNQQEGEFWGAMYVRYTAFPWNKYLYTTFALSTGLSYATGISDFEKAGFPAQPAGRNACDALLLAGADLRIARSQGPAIGHSPASPFRRLWRRQRRLQRRDLSDGRAAILVLATRKITRSLSGVKKSCRWWWRGHKACRRDPSGRLPRSPPCGRDGRCGLPRAPARCPWSADARNSI